MLTVKEAVRAAEEWVRELYPHAALEHLRLEEVQLSDDASTWEITLGWVEPAVRENAFAAVLAKEANVLPRVYKRLEVDAANGAVRSMKIREVE